MTQPLIEEKRPAMRIFVGHRINEPHGQQFLVRIYRNGTFEFDTRSTDDTAESWVPVAPTEAVLTELLNLSFTERPSR